jgi:sec-independent protein translocase protein TatA
MFVQKIINYSPRLSGVFSVIIKLGYKLDYTLFRSILKERTEVNIFGIGLPEMAVIMVVALLVFGPKKLPEIGRSLGKTLRSFQDASKEFETEFQKEAQKIENSVKMNAQLEESKQQQAVSKENTVSVEQNSSS